MHNLYATAHEKEYLRELAKKQLEYANLPVMEERKRLWYDHNSLKPVKPVIVMEVSSFEGSLLPALKCQSPAAREVEKELLRNIVNHELVDDDKVIPSFYEVDWKINIREFGLDMEVEHATDSMGRTVARVVKHPISDLEKDFSLLGPSQFSVDRELTYGWKAFVEDVIGDILPVKIRNSSLTWYLSPSVKVVHLMGLENMMYAMVDYPDKMHALYSFLRDDILSFVKWQEREGLLTLNNENNYAGAGSYGFTRELPRKQNGEAGPVSPQDLWGNLNSQETVGISSKMYGEFIFPYYVDIAREFGLVYYGCCEPVHDIWVDYLSKLPNLRKVSISAWCNEEYMGNALKGSNIIYSRKASPNYIGVGSFDEAAFRAHISKTLEAARGCHLEFIFRDVYTLDGDISKPGKAVSAVRELIETLW